MAEFPVLVDGLPADLDVDSIRNKLSIYFQSKRKSGGGECEVKVHQDPGKALVYFRVEEVQQNVLKKESHKVKLSGSEFIQLRVTLFEEDNPVKKKEFSPRKPATETNSLQASAQNDKTSEQSSAGASDTPKGDSDQSPAVFMVTSETPISTEVIMLYFENIAEDTKVSEKGKSSWFVICPSKDGREKILSRKQHKVLGNILTVQAYNTKGELQAFVLKGFDGSARLDHISLYLDNCSGNAEHSIELLGDDETLVVVFQTEIDSHSFVLNCYQKLFANNRISAEYLQSTDTVYVEGIQPTHSDDFLRLYFSNQKRSGGGVLAEMSVKRQEGTAILQFEDPKVVRRLVDKDHKETQLTVNPHYPSLGAPVYRSNDPIPINHLEEFTIAVNPCVLQHLQKERRCIQDLDEIAKSVYCSYTFQGNHFVLKPSVNENTQLYFKIAKKWRKNVEDKVEEFINRFDYKEESADAELWDKVKNKCRGLRSPWMDLQYSDQTKKIIMVGKQEIVCETSRKMRDILKKAKDEIEQERTIVEEKIQFARAVELAFVFNHIKNDVQEVKLSRSKSPPVLTVKGVKKKVKLALTCINSFQSQLRNRPLGLSPTLEGFIRTLDLEKVAQIHFVPNNIKATLVLKGKLDILAIEGDVQKAQDKLKQVFGDETLNLTPEQIAVTEGDGWKVFLGELEAEAKSSSEGCRIELLKNPGSVMLTGFTNMVTDIKIKLCDYLDKKRLSSQFIPATKEQVDFVENCLDLSELLDLKNQGISLLPVRTLPTGLKVTGTAENLNTAVSAIKKELLSIQSETFTYDKPGEALALIKQNDSLKVKAGDNGCMCVLEFVTNETSTCLSKHKLPNGLSLTIWQKDILHQRADAVVCQLCNCSDPVTGVTKAILTATGIDVPEMINDIKSIMGALTEETALAISAGTLPFKELILAVTPGVGSGVNPVVGNLQSVVMNCLETAEVNQCQSIAFPTLGRPGSTLDQRVRETLTAILENCKETKSKNKYLQHIHLVEKDGSTANKFKEMAQMMVVSADSINKVDACLKKSRQMPTTLKQGYVPSVPAMLLLPTVQIAGKTVMLKKGDITQESTEAIVNSNNNSLDLNSGVSGAILKAAGSTVKDECKKIGSQANDGVVVTGGGQLQCLYIMHMVGPKTAPLITAAVEKTLGKCDQLNIATVAFPAIGTGNAGIDFRVAINAIFVGMENYFLKNTASSLKTINIVAFETNVHDIFATFFDERQQMSSGGTEGTASVAPSSTLSPASFQFTKRTMLPTQIKIHETIVEVKQGDITLDTVKAIVNSTNTTLNLNSGVSGAIFTAAGNTVVDECKKLGTQPADGVVVTGPGNLNCDHIIHMVGQTSAPTITSSVEKVLKECERLQVTTVSFPALGTGAGGLKPEVVIESMLIAFENHLSQTNPSVIKFIYIDIFEPKMFDPFVDALKWQVQEKKNLVEIKLGKIKVQLIQGDIIKEKTDAIVNSNNVSLNLQTGVSGAILKAAGKSVVDECQSLGVQNKDSVSVTKAGNLRVKSILHLSGWTQVKQTKLSIGKVLNQCQNLNISSVSFPAMGTGQGKLNPSNVVNAMLDAVADYVLEFSQTSLSLIRIVVLRPDVLNEFWQGFAIRFHTLRNIQPVPVQVIQPVFPIILSASKFQIGTVRVYGTSKAAMAKVRKDLDDIIGQNWCSKTTDFDCAAGLSSDEKQKIAELCTKHQLKLEIQEKKIITEGYKEHVLETMLTLNHILQSVKDREGRKEDEAHLKNFVSWETVQNRKAQPYDTSLNYELEKAYQAKKPSYTYTKNMQSFTVHFDRMEQTDSSKNVVPVRRKNPDMAQFEFPASWSHMNDQDHLEVVLQVGSAEYTKVANDFTTSCQNIAVKIIQIDRIQQRRLWQCYSVRKETVDKKYPNVVNEQILYHGTTREIADKLNKLGFNRSFCGRNATVYGRGTYFAKNAQYSCDNKYSSPSDQGYKYMFQARVITGKMCLGDQSLIEPTPVDPNKDPTNLCDCAVDSVSNPSIFVIFCDDGAYPEYLITFKM
eukprot:gi/632957508/ref/XP_007894518.1/ PREDICTED: poly [ADP-ribose] polymerase 14-like [Callorhinchus milii]